MKSFSGVENIALWAEMMIYIRILSCFWEITTVNKDALVLVASSRHKKFWEAEYDHFWNCKTAFQGFAVNALPN